LTLQVRALYCHSSRRKTRSRLFDPDSRVDGSTGQGQDLVDEHASQPIEPRDANQSKSDLGVVRGPVRPILNYKSVYGW
jgi:hypothetical protein